MTSPEPDSSLSGMCTVQASISTLHYNAIIKYQTRLIIRINWKKILKVQDL